jgi:cytochrome c2
MCKSKADNVDSYAQNPIKLVRGTELAYSGSISNHSSALRKVFKKCAGPYRC